VQKRLARGRVEITVALQLRQPAAPDVVLNAEFAEALARVIEQARSRGLVGGPLNAGDLLRMPQALTIRERLVESAGAGTALGSEVEGAVMAGVAQLDEMRAREGVHLRADLDARKSLLSGLIARIAAAAAAGMHDLEARLLERAREIAGALPIDQAALSQEVVRVAQRSDISEEVTRFHGHLAHWDALSDSAEPCGRKLDFLLQEMNREINTIGSKADGLQVAEVVIEAKAELERMREQVQNVE
jgi:uncharacterized protein (TIGR00255 family)